MLGHAAASLRLLKLSINVHAIMIAAPKSPVVPNFSPRIIQEMNAVRTGWLHWTMDTSDGADHERAKFWSR